jgi:multidrug resistance protein
MFAPSVPLMLSDFSLPNTPQNSLLGTLAVSLYLLGYSLGPLIIAPLSELYGRLPLYFTTMTLFILCNMACGFSTNIAMIIAFRLLTGCVGAGPLTIGPGSVGDLFEQTQRGRAMAVWTMPVLLGPCLGPAVGAYLGRAVGWRWEFWGLSIVVSLLLSSPVPSCPGFFPLQIRFLRENGHDIRNVVKIID